MSCNGKRTGVALALFVFVVAVIASDPRELPGTCLAHVWDDVNGNGIQEGVTRHRAEPEPNLEGVQITVTDSAAVEHVGISDSFGNVVLPEVATGAAMVSVLIPPGFMMTTPMSNPFDVVIPPGPGAHAIPAIGIIAVGPAVPERSTARKSSDIAAAVVGGVILLLLVALLIKGLTARQPSEWPQPVAITARPAAAPRPAVTTNGIRAVKLDYDRPPRRV